MAESKAMAIELHAKDNSEFSRPENYQIGILSIDVRNLCEEIEKLKGDAIAIAKGCFDYRGGYHSEKELEIYYHGIQTVINVLEAANKNRMDDLQVATIHAIGKGNCS